MLGRRNSDAGDLGQPFMQCRREMIKRLRYHLSNIRKPLSREKQSNSGERAQPAAEGLSSTVAPKLYSRIFSSVFSFTLKSALVAACSVAVGIFIARLLGPTELGKFSLIITVSNTIGALIGLGLLQTLAKFIPQKLEINEKSELYTKSLTIVFLLFIVCAILYFVITTLLPVLPGEIKEVSFAFILLVGTGALLSINKGMLRGFGRFGLLPNLEAVQNLLPRIIALPILFYLVTSYKVVFYNVFFFQFLVLAITFYLLKPYLRVRGVRDLKIEKQVITFSLIMLGGSITYMLCTTVDTVLLRAMMNSEEVGYYAAGTQGPLVIQGMFLSPLAVPFLYYFSHPESAAETPNIIRYGTRVIGFAAGLVALVVFALADKLILFFLGADYSNSIAVLQIFSAHTFLLGILTFSAIYFLSINKPHIGVLIGLSSFAFNFIFDLILIPRMGASGAALASIIGQVISTMLYVAIMRRFGINLTVIFALFAMLGISFFASFRLYPSVGIPIYLLLGFVTRMITKQDIKNVYLVIKTRGKLE